MLNDLVTFADVVAEKAGQFLVAFAAIGAITMAIVQTVKELTPVKSRFHAFMVQRWLRRCHARTGGKPGDGTCIDQLVELATAGDSAALYGLDVERLAGQLSAAATVVIDFPSQPGNDKVLECLAAGADPDDVEAIIQGHSSGRTHLEHLRENDHDAFDRLLDSKTRVTHYIQRNIDGFQISTGFRWKWLLQLASFAVSFVVAIVGLAYTDSEPGFDLWMLWRAAPLALVAGFIAPIARDLVAVVDKARRP